MGVFVGIDWAEAHHDIVIEDDQGELAARRRISDDLSGVGMLHELLADHADDPTEVVIGIETDRGLLVNALVAAGHDVFAVNPLSVARYRDRHTTSRAKSDRGDAKVLADLVRTDRHNHRPVAADSTLAQSIRHFARAHQNLIWTRQRQTNQLRSNLREYYPGALAAFDDLAHRDTIAILAIAPTPELGRHASTAKIRTALQRGGRQRNLDNRAQAIRDTLRAAQLEAPEPVADAMGATTAALVALIKELNAQIAAVEAKLVDRFRQHPHAERLLSLPGLGPVLGARILGELGDAPNRYRNAKARRNYAGTSPITVASGTSEAVLARHIRNDRLFDACWQWAFCALTASPGARAYYEAHNPGPHTSKGARRKLANKLVGILHGCLAHDTHYDEHHAFGNWLHSDREHDVAA